MDFGDFIIPPTRELYEQWQLGALLSDEIEEGGLALLWVSDYRGVEGSAEILDFSMLREQLFTLSASDFELPICDLGDLVSGKTLEDTHYALQEVLLICHHKNAIPIVIGGGNDLSFSLFAALNQYQSEVNYTQISNVIALQNPNEPLSEDNFLAKIFSSKNFSVKQYNHLGYQKHLNDVEQVKLMKDLGFDTLRLAEMMNGTERCEPYFRRADLVTINTDSVESFGKPFSIHPQINGLNRREVCAYMKEVGLGENLKSVGLFNLNIEKLGVLNGQLLSQMLWYLIEGINIQKSHPKEKTFDTFWVMVEDKEYAFHRDAFSGLWYFGEGTNVEEWLPCSAEAYEMAKRGVLNMLLMKYLERRQR